MNQEAEIPTSAQMADAKLKLFELCAEERKLISKLGGEFHQRLIDAENKLRVIRGELEALDDCRNSEVSVIQSRIFVLWALFLKDLNAV